MASQQAYHAYTQNKGTLVPGQTISVNKYNVQVERYLSQGGFAHVYLVRTATPVYNTTQHVLKRIAVANDAMLVEVKKEVDIMRLLKGHPNIVHLIDAAWHRMPNGMYEVFILMEFCAGGGIIDMMNRRLRERLTEAEILQIFVDVCEGVAYMHNLRPPLLHRDLKVENILQASPTTFKLCDFGSATTVSPRPPSTTQEIRALEADLNRHTTLQYRAPEMVDPYLRRPVDEKSDVWALGVLLYKLCYYTTPFEEHGPLAILNVQYRIPPYPSYSPQMNALIASMLREHGTQRPSVFELLTSVHRLRGTKSQFHYNIPVPQPLSPSHQQHHLKPYSSPSSAPSYRPSSSPSKSPNAGVQAREKVLEAIAPMRRGRPNIPDSQDYKHERSRSRPRSPQKAKPQTQPVAKHKTKDWLDGDADGFDAAEEKAWKDISRTAGVGDGDAWDLSAGRNGKENEKAKSARGFGDDFAEKLWDTFDPNAQRSSNSPGSSTTKVTITPIRPRPPAFTGTDIHSSPVLGSTPSYSPRGKDDKDKDAFAGLGFGTPAAPPTLAEARKLRTGLATAPSPVSMNLGSNGHGYKSGSGASPRPTPSPRPPYLPPSQSSASAGPPSSIGTPTPSWKLPLPQPPQQQLTSRSRPPSSAQLDAAESRFPSLEELDATFVGHGHGHGRSATSSETYSSKRQTLTSTQPPQLSDRPPQLPARNNNNNNIGSGSGSSTTGGNSLRPAVNTYQQNGTRSQQVTGVAMRETDSRRGGDDSSRGERDREKATPEMPRRKEMSTESSRPPLVRKHRSSVSVKHNPRPSLEDNQSYVYPKVDSGLATPRRRSPHDWLTGDDDFQNNENTPTQAPPTTSTSTTLVSNSEASTPVLRASPSKRASYIEQSNIPIQTASVAQRDVAPSPQPPPSPSPTSTSTTSSYLTRAARVFPPVQLDTTTTTVTSTAEALTDNWSPVASTPSTNIVGKQKEMDSSSSADEGPEDASAYVPRAPLKAEKPKRKGRQSSVHDLVDLWGGAGKDKEKEKERNPGGTFENLIDVENHKPTAHLPPISTNPNQLSYAPPSSSLLSPKPVDRSTGNVSPKRPSHYEPSSRKQPSPIRASPAPSPGGRSRPQSMFLFPSSKSANDGLPSASGRGGLSPPTEDPSRPKNIRRTSISDMVQRYEAIGGKTSTSGSGAPPPNILPKPVALKVATQNTENGRYPLKVNSPITSRGNINGVGRMLPIADELPDTNTTNLFGSEGAPNRRSPTSGGFPARLSPNLPRNSPLPNRTSPSRTPRQESGRTTEADRGPTSSSSSSLDLPPSNFNYGYSARKTTISDDSSSRSSGDVNGQGAPSPERPYQGVGKLIDQWQRKTAESEPSPRLRTGSGFGAKRERAGLMSTSGGGGGGNK